MKKIVIGILAHVDAGKTTLSESLLYTSGVIRKLGRVDHQDAFLDYDIQERNRGITIFSKQAIFPWKDIEITLIDTPGHVDFAAEMERTLQILDYAIIVISGLDGVQTHTETIWSLLRHYQVPTFIFVNKTDRKQVDEEIIYEDLRTKLDTGCIDFRVVDNNFYENIALTDDSFLEQYIDTQCINHMDIQDAIIQRKVFPCYFGSALKMQGVETFLNGLESYTKEKQYPLEFGAKVYKISRDEQGNKLTHMKITGGSLKVKELLLNNEKVDQIRRYSGTKYEMVNMITAGKVCAVKGLQSIYAGQGLGIERTDNQSVLSSYMNYRLVLPSTCDEYVMLKYLQQLAEEDPQLSVHYQEHTKEIFVQLMGEVQIDVIKNIIKNRFDIEITFDQGKIVYKETIVEPVEGIGHYEPLGHYAEVHLLLEPGEVGSGIQVDTICKEDNLDRNFQRLIISHILEKEHMGVLTGSPITDIKITLLTGKAHLKHTEGGDFRQATYRAIRQGLKSTKNQLLEPYYQFTLEIPTTHLSKAIYDLEQMQGEFEIPVVYGEMMTIKGIAPISKMQKYQATVISYTKGLGKLYGSLYGYKPCHNEEEIMTTIDYNSETDVDNPTGSVFCSHGAGFGVPWNQVRDYMHIDSGWSLKKEKEKPLEVITQKTMSEKELEHIFNRTFGPVKRRNYRTEVNVHHDSQTTITHKPECLLVDGYNVIHAWSSLKSLVPGHLDVARTKLIEAMCNYQGYKQCILILVFDAYKVKGNPGMVEKYDNIYIIYTKEAQTADAYIERVTQTLNKDYSILVATSDALEQLIVVGQGARRISSRELEEEVEYIHQEQMKEYERKNTKGYNYLLKDIKDFEGE